MEVQKLQCTSCGAPIQVPPDIDTFNCSYCGASLVVRRGEGFVALQLAEKVARAVEESGVKTQAAIRQESEATRTHLQQLELRQQLSTAESQLTALDAEVRSIERQRRKSARDKRQLKQLKRQQTQQRGEIKRLQRALADIKTAPVPKMNVTQATPIKTVAPKAAQAVPVKTAVPKAPLTEEQKRSRNRIWGFIGLFFAFAFVLMIPTMALGLDDNTTVQTVVMGGALLLTIVVTNRLAAKKRRAPEPAASAGISKPADRSAEDDQTV